MSKVALSSNPSGTGTFTIASPNGNTDRTLTLPDASGTMLTTATPGVPVNGPAFLAFQSAPTSIVSATATKVLFGNEVFDTNSNFVSSRFTPTVAGYYQINANVSINQPGNASNIVSLFKNGVEYMRGGRSFTTLAANLGLPVAAIIYMNGSTDYVEVYFYTNNGTCDTEPGASSHFSGALVRSAT